MYLCLAPLAHALQCVHRLRDRVVVATCCGLHEGNSFLRQSLQTHSWFIFSAELRHRVLSLCHSLWCLFLLLQSLYTACEMDFDYCLLYQKQSVCRNGDLWWWVGFSPFVSWTQNQTYPVSLLCSGVSTWHPTCKFLFALACVCVFHPRENDLKCAQKWQKCRPMGFWMFYSLSL